MQYCEDYLEVAERMYSLAADSHDVGVEHVVEYAMWLENQAFKAESRPAVESKKSSMTGLRELERDLASFFGGAF